MQLRELLAKKACFTECKHSWYRETASSEVPFQPQLCISLEASLPRSLAPCPCSKSRNQEHLMRCVLHWWHCLPHWCLSFPVMSVKSSLLLHLLCGHQQHALVMELWDQVWLYYPAWLQTLSCKQSSHTTMSSSVCYYVIFNYVNILHCLFLTDEYLGCFQGDSYKQCYFELSFPCFSMQTDAFYLSLDARIQCIS